MSECYNAAGNPDPTQYVNASGVCVQAGGRRRRASRSTRLTRSRRQNVAARRNSRRQNVAMRRNSRQNATRRRRNNGTGMRRRR